MKYGYVRVSTTTQNIDRQMEEMHKFGLTDEFIYIDKQSGKDFDRPNYQIMKSKLKKDDLLIIKSIDRLGRNYEMIIKEWSDITKIIEADICVIDFPLLDTRSENTNLVGKFISDIVLSHKMKEKILDKDKPKGLELQKRRGFIWEGQNINYQIILLKLWCDIIIKN